MPYDLWQTCAAINIGLTRAECASWVQAWGSILAIAVAGGTAVAQIAAARKHELATERRKRVALIEVIATLARLLEMEIQSRASRVRPNGSDEKMQRMDAVQGRPFADIHAAAAAIPIHELADLQVVQLAFSLRRLTALAIEVVDRIDAAWDTTDGVFVRAREPFGAVLMGLTELRGRCLAATVAR